MSRSGSEIPAKTDFLKKTVPNDHFSPPTRAAYDECAPKIYRHSAKTIQDLGLRTPRGSTTVSSRLRFMPVSPMTNSVQTGRPSLSYPRTRIARGLVIMLVGLIATAGPIQTVAACPFCSAASQPLREEMKVMDSVIIATALDSDLTRNKEDGEVRMKVLQVLKGGDLVKVGQVVDAIYYGDVTAGRRFMLSGVDPPELQWSCLPVNERAEKYIVDISKLPSDDDLAVLRFFHDYLEDEDSMLSRDAYDEFATAGYDVIRQLKDDMDHDQLVEWISTDDMSADRKRLYLTMLGVCGSDQDLPFLEGLMRSTKKSSRAGLDALVACYLTLSGEPGLSVIDELFLNNKKAPYADTFAAVMAVRFHGTEGNVIPRSALLESLHHIIERKDLADLVIPDLARWQDWSQVERLTQVFIDSDEDNNWVRVPIVNYLRACPLPKAKTAIKKLEEVDPDSVKRANTFFSVPQPVKDTTPATSAIPAVSDPAASLAGKPLSLDAAQGPLTIGQRTALAGGENRDASESSVGLPVAAVGPVLNPWRLLYVVGIAMASVMIAQYLLLSGGAQPQADR